MTHKTDWPMTNPHSYRKKDIDRAVLYNGRRWYISNMAGFRTDGDEIYYEYIDLVAADNPDTLCTVHYVNLTPVK